MTTEVLLRCGGNSDRVRMQQRGGILIPSARYPRCTDDAPIPATDLCLTRPARSKQRWMTDICPIGPASIAVETTSAADVGRREESVTSIAVAERAGRKEGSRRYNIYAGEDDAQACCAARWRAERSNGNVPHAMALTHAAMMLSAVKPRSGRLPAGETWSCDQVLGGKEAPSGILVGGPAWGGWRSEESGM